MKEHNIDKEDKKEYRTYTLFSCFNQFLYTLKSKVKFPLFLSQNI